MAHHHHDSTVDSAIPVVPDDNELWGPNPYDINYCFPVENGLSSLKNDLVKLTPFVPRVHARTFWERFLPAREEALRYIPWHLDKFEDLLRLLEFDIRHNPYYTLFAIIDKTKPSDGHGIHGAVAGIIGLLNAIPSNLSVELGALIVLPDFQRTHVTSNAVGLLLHYCLNTSNAPTPSLGLRRVQWSAFVGNEPSVRVATRMGFKLEKTRRWLRVLPPSASGLLPRKGDPFSERPGVHSMLYSICWDDWEAGLQDSVAELMIPKKTIPMAEPSKTWIEDEFQFVNLYHEDNHPQPITSLYGPDPYDVNFMFPLHLESLKNDLVKLTPFVPRLHAASFWEQFESVREQSLRYFPWKINTLNDLLEIIETQVRRSPDWAFFAILDKTRAEEAVAGIIAYLRTSSKELSTEIGAIIVLPKFRRTHITSNAIGLLMHHALDLPQAQPPGLGLRRIVWTVHPDNAASIAAASRMGFVLEGTSRWTRAVGPPHVGLSPRKDDPLPSKDGWHATTFAVCWDDWENGVMANVDQVMSRKYKQVDV